MPQYASSTAAASAGRRALGEGRCSRRGRLKRTLTSCWRSRVVVQVEVAEALVAPLPLRGEADDQIGGHDQEVPLPPARVPLALPRDGDADQRLGEQHETGDHGAIGAGRAPVRGRCRRRSCRIAHASRLPQRPRCPARRAAAGQAVQTTRRHRRQHGGAEKPAGGGSPAGQKLRPHVDERGSCREPRADQQADRDRDPEARVVAREEDAARPERVEPHEASRRHEGEREEEHPRVSDGGSPPRRRQSRARTRSCRPPRTARNAPGSSRSEGRAASAAGARRARSAAARRRGARRSLLRGSAAETGPPSGGGPDRRRVTDRGCSRLPWPHDADRASDLPARPPPL